MAFLKKNHPIPPVSRVIEIIQKEPNFEFLKVFSTYFMSLKINAKTSVSRIIKDTKINQLQKEGEVKR